MGFVIEFHFFVNIIKLDNFPYFAFLQIRDYDRRKTTV